MESNVAVIATGNAHKLQEINEILKDFKLEIKSMKNVGLEGLEIIEDGSSFEENALIKARTVTERTGYMAIADDSGLEVDCLDKKPGIYSARFAGEEATDEENNEKLLRLLKDVPIEERSGRYVCAIAVVMPDGKSFAVRGELPGVIAYEPRGDGGFGYDPLFIVEGHQGLTLAEISLEEKNKISHRSQALKEMKKALIEKLRSE